MERARNSKTKYRFFLIRCEHDDRETRVWAGSYAGAMRAAFGPGMYRVQGILNEDQRQMRCPQGRSFVVTDEK